MFNNSIFGGTYAIDDNIDISIMRTRQYFDYLIKYCFNRFKWDLPEKAECRIFYPNTFYQSSVIWQYFILKIFPMK